MLEKDLEAVLGFVPEPGDNLLDAGLDSVRLMRLAARWDVDLADLAEAPTLEAWRRLVADRS